MKIEQEIENRIQGLVILKFRRELLAWKYRKTTLYIEQMSQHNLTVKL